jgi:isoquinoline 1-oxidoreductase subunit alpha
MKITVNGTDRTIAADPEKPLLWVIREDLGLTGTKFGCGIGQCGACTVLVNGEATRTCVTPLSVVEGADIRTIESLAANGKLSRVQEAWIAEQAPQCGYCQSGMIMAATALLSKTTRPTEADIKTEITNLCRCGSYPRVTQAILRAAEQSGV